MKVLALGGTRFIGAAAVRALVARGHEVRCFHRGLHHAQLPAGVTYVHGERAELGAHRAELMAFGPDVLLDMRPLHAADARQVMELARGLARRVVAVSSMDVYKAFGVVLGKETWPADARYPGGFDPRPIDEAGPLREVPFPHRQGEGLPADHPQAWTNDYDKIPAEAVFLGEPELPGTVLRLPMVYGPEDYQRRVQGYLAPMLAGREAILLADELAGWETTRGYVDDVGQAIALAVADERAAGRVYNVGEPEFQSERAWVEAIAEAAGWSGRIVSAPAARLPESLQPGLVPQPLRCLSGRIRAELGYAEGLPAAERVARSVAWERAQPAGEPRDYAAEDAALASL